MLSDSHAHLTLEHLDPDRDEMPDIDLDICQNGRAAVLDYVRSKYGHVAQIITFGTLKAKAAVKDVARVMGLGFEEANQLTKLIPSELNMTLDKALTQLARRRKSSRSAVVREAIEAMTRGEKRSVTELAGDLVGRFHGPGDLSSNPKYMDDFGK